MNFPYFIITLAILFFACQESETNTNKTVNPSANTSEVVNNEEKETTGKILFFGNSLTAAYGLDPTQGYVSLIQNRLDSLKLNYTAINAGLSGETTAGGKERIDWVLRQPIDIFVLELGGNDALRGIEVKASIENLQSIIDQVKQKYSNVKIILAGMEAPPNMGQEYTDQFRVMYRDLAKKNELTLIPFFLENVGGIPALNLPDGIHPNVEGQKILVENVWRYLEPLL